MKNKQDGYRDKTVPRQYTGKHVDLFVNRTYADQQEAIDFFLVAKNRLLDINHWHDIANVPSATFMLTDPFGGEAVKSRPDEGDRVRIDIPGPGPTQGDGYDWVIVERVVETEVSNGAFCELILRPTSNPLKPGDDTAHFFEDTASSTLIVERQGKDVIASYHGRNEVANTNTESAVDNIRNSAVGVAAKLGLSYPQWKGLIEGIVDTSR